MREIKFRVYSKDHGFLGDVYEIDFAYGLVKVQRDDFETTHTLGITNVDLIQFTGLKDKNGTEIYEGDIICIAKDMAFPVIYDDEFGSFHLDGSGEHMYGAGYAEVIGNIYENQDLLK